MKSRKRQNGAAMQNTGVGCETHAALLCCTLLLQAAASRLPSNNKRLHVGRCNRSSSKKFFYYLPPSPWSKHFPTLANFSRRVLICNSLGCFLRLRALLSRMHNLHRRVRVCAHENPKASQRGVVTVISFSPTAVIGFYAPTLHYLQGRGAGGQRCCYYSPAG